MERGQHYSVLVILSLLGCIVFTKCNNCVIHQELQRSGEQSSIDFIKPNSNDTLLHIENEDSEYCMDLDKLPLSLVIKNPHRIDGEHVPGNDILQIREGFRNAPGVIRETEQRVISRQLIADRQEDKDDYRRLVRHRQTRTQHRLDDRRVNEERQNQRFSVQSTETGSERRQSSQFQKIEGERRRNSRSLSRNEQRLEIREFHEIGISRRDQLRVESRELAYSRRFENKENIQSRFSRRRESPVEERSVGRGQRDRREPATRRDGMSRYDEDIRRRIVSQNYRREENSEMRTAVGSTRRIRNMIPEVNEIIIPSGHKARRDLVSSSLEQNGRRRYDTDQSQRRSRTFTATRNFGRLVRATDETEQASRREPKSVEKEHHQADSLRYKDSEVGSLLVKASVGFLTFFLMSAERFKLGLTNGF